MLGARRGEGCQLECLRRRDYLRDHLQLRSARTGGASALDGLCSHPLARSCLARQFPASSPALMLRPPPSSCTPRSLSGEDPLWRRPPVWFWACDVAFTLIFTFEVRCEM